MSKVYQWVDQAWQWLAERVFVRFELDLPAGDLRRLAGEGKLIFSLTEGGIVEWLILSSWSRKHGLGAIIVANRKRILFLSRFHYFVKVLFRRTSYADLFLGPEPGPRLIFCRPAERKALFDATPSERLLAEMFRRLAPTQSYSKIRFAPVLVLWRKYARGAGRRPIEYLLGSSANPNLFGKAYYLFRQRPDSTVRSLPVFPLTPASGDSDAMDEAEPERVAKAARRKIIVSIQQEMRIILGPRHDSPNLVKEAILRDPETKALLSKVAEQRHVDVKKLMQEAYRDLTEIAADRKVGTVGLFALFLRWLFTKVFDGVVCSPADLEHVRGVMRRRAVVFIPCHRSHFDYLVMPYVLHENDIVTPYIAAGINLSFWPVGPLLRSAGAFFIRRSFRGDEIYAHCLKKYVEYLLKNRSPFKFFIEGTRSRSGKMLPPAYGLLKTVLERYEKNIVDDIALVPVSITYDEVPEEGAYSLELRGEKKVKESAGALIRARRVIQRRLGRVYLNFAPEISARETFERARESSMSELTLQKTAFHICKEICSVTPVTAKAILASVLLNHCAGTLSLEDILRLADRLADYAAWSKTPLSSGAGQDLKRAIEQTLRGLKRKAVVGIDEARVPRLYYCEDGRRTLLTYYKNTALHCFVQPNLALLGLLRALSSGRASRADVIASAVQLRDILKFEFFFDPKATFVKEVESILCYFLGDDWLGERFDLKRALSRHFPENDDLTVFTSGVGYLLESYLIVIHVAMEKRGCPEIDEKIVLTAAVREAQTLRERRQLRFPESVSVQNFSNGILLLENMGYLKRERRPGKTALAIGEWTPEMEETRRAILGYLEVLDAKPRKIVAEYASRGTSAGTAPVLEQSSET